MANRFFITGCQRSGTTLTRLILESHPQIACLDETRAYAVLGGEPYDIPAGITHLGFKIPRWAERFGESGGEVPDGGFYRGESIIFLLRELRDTIASMKRLKALDSPSWLTAWGVPILKKKIETDPVFRERYPREIEIVRSSGFEPAAAGALYWLDKTQSYFRYHEMGWPIVGILYRTFVGQPIPCLRAMLNTLGVPWDDAVLHHPQFPHEEMFPDGTTVGGTDPARPIDAKSVGIWREFLTPDEERIALEIAGDMNERILSMPLPRIEESPA